MAFPNILALILLSPVVFKETKIYFSRLDTGEIEDGVSQKQIISVDEE